jgi:hypothetical protein
MATSSSPPSIAESRTLQVVKAAGGGGTGTWASNEPASMTAISPLNFDVNLSTIPNLWSDSNVSRLSYVVDPTSPSPGDNVGRLLYPAGRAGGAQTVGISCLQEPAAVVKRLYYCVGLKMSNNFQFHVTGTNKVFFIGVDGYGGGGDPYFCNIDSDTNPPQFRGVLQGPLGRIFPGGSGNRVNRGEWFVAEAEMLMNTPGNADGVYRQWVNGQLATELLNVEYANAVYAWNNFPGINNTWGGAGDTVVEDFYLDVSELYVSWSEI